MITVFGDTVLVGPILEITPLIGPTLLIFCTALIVSYRVLKLVMPSILLATIKSSIFFIYFAFFFDGYYTFLDDRTYLYRGLQIINYNINPFDFGALSGVSQSQHIIYEVFNAYAMRLFGEYYFAPVALNVCISILTAWLGVSLAREALRFTESERKWFFAWLMLHPDIVAWSSITNLKDILALFCYVLFLWSFWFLIQRRLIRFLSLFIAVSAITFFLRYYVPILFGISLITYIVARGHWKQLLSLLILLLPLSMFIWPIIEDGLQVLKANPILGFAKAMLSPLPFNNAPGFEFHNIPSLFHWLALPAMLWGMLVVSRRGRKSFGFLIVICFFVFIALYAVNDLTHPARHRVQLDYTIALFQFVGLSSFFRSLSHTKARQANEGAAVQPSSVG